MEREKKHLRQECGKEFLVQACLRAPHVVADEAKLAIVFTYFFLFAEQIKKYLCLSVRLSVCPRF